MIPCFIAAILGSLPGKLMYSTSLSGLSLLRSNNAFVPAAVEPPKVTPIFFPLRSAIFWISGVTTREKVGRPTFSLVVTPDIQKIADLKGKKIGVTFGGSTAAGTKALLDLNKLNPDKDVEYINFPGNEPKIAAMKQGIISAALLAPPADYLAMRSGMKRLVSLADVFKDTAFTGLAATSKTIKENPQMVKRMV